MSKYTTFFDAWHFLDNHPMFKKEEDKNKWGTHGHFRECLDIMVTKVNPANDTIEDDKSLNTKTVVWLECGPYDPRYGVHDIDLDTGADTFEDAIVNLAQLVLDNPDYGDYVEPEITPEQREELDAFMQQLIDANEGR